MAEENQEISRIAAKVPPFWKDNPVLWFKQLEAHFSINRITADQTKYYTVVGYLESHILAYVSDIVLSPPAENLYRTIKNRLINEFQDSEEGKLKKLLTGIHLGDKKPSHLLKEMRELSSNRFTEDVLKSLWIQHLPTSVQTVLMVSEVSLTKMAELADKIMGIIPDPNISTVSSNATTSNADPSLEVKINSLESQLKHLSQEIDKLSSQGMGNSQNNYRRFEKKFWKKKEDKPISSELCWYHKTYGSRANKCISPCKFFPQTEN